MLMQCNYYYLPPQEMKGAASSYQAPLGRREEENPCPQVQKVSGMGKDWATNTQENIYGVCETKGGRVLGV